MDPADTLQGPGPGGLRWDLDLDLPVCLGVTSTSSVISDDDVITLMTCDCEFVPLDGAVCLFFPDELVDFKVYKAVRFVTSL